MGKRKAFQAVLGVLTAVLFLALPAAASAGEVRAPLAAPLLLAQAPEAAPARPAEAAPETAPAAPQDAAPMAPEAAPVAPEAASTAPPEAASTAPPEAAPTAPPEAAPTAPSEAAPAAPPESAPAGPAEATAPVSPPAAEAEAAGSAAYPNGLVHTVVQGDTLWDLSAKYLGSPWRWTELWERNRFLTNPHYIYPGIRVVIFPPPPREYEMAGKEPGPEAEAGAAPAVAPPAPAAEAEPVVPEVAEAAPAPGPARILDITELDYVRAGEFHEKRPRGIGRLLGGLDVRVVFGEGEKVVLSLKKDIPAGQLLGIYRVRGPVRGPSGRRVSGYVKHLVGLVQVLGRENGAVVGRIRKSFEELTRRDIITEEIPGYAPVVVDPGKPDIEASVITGRLENVALAQGDFVYLDRGSNDGIARGNVFRFLRKAGDSSYRIEVAQGVAIRVLPKFTTIYVVKSTQSFEAGVSARRGDAPTL